jgi:hypothetical protein
MLHPSGTKSGNARIGKTVQAAFTVYICLFSLVSAHAQQPTLPVCADEGTWSTEEFVIGGEAVQISTPLLLTSGQVMVQYRGGLTTGNPEQDWYALTPSITGCYSLNAAECAGGFTASWSELASLTTITSATVPAYGPTFFASAVLPSGNVIIEGGEYNMGTGVAERVLYNGGAYYNSAANTWKNVPPPTAAAWANIGDAPSTVLAGGKFLLGNACGINTGVGLSALLDESNLTWKNTVGQPQEWTAEGSFTLLPDKSVITVGTCYATDPPRNTCTTVPTNPNNYQLYDPALGTWSSPGNTPNTLYSSGTGLDEENSCFSGGPIFGEQGPAGLLPDGTYFATGGFVENSTLPAGGEDYASVYNVATQIWSNAPPLPGVTINKVPFALSAEDQGSVVLRDGHYLIATMARNNFELEGSIYYLEWNGKSYCELNNLPVGIPNRSFMLTLPTGQIFITDYVGTNNYFIYTPGATIYPGIAPTLTSVSSATLDIGHTYTATGTQFNGATQSSFFGDDFQNATNYPLVRITNNSTGHIFYAKTTNPSTMGVATGNEVTTVSFEILAGTETGASSVVVVANGIPSNTVSVTVKK